MKVLLVIRFLIPLLLCGAQCSRALPLSTSSRWIVDDGSSGKRVKLACLSWASHLDTMVAEGLNKQPVDAISNRFGVNGFNCVRLTWALYLMTNETLGTRTVRQSFHWTGLSDVIPGVQQNNPSLLDMSLREAFKEVVASLTRNSVMVILDNHISKPGWCCSDDDGSGFFGDQYFNPDEWILGLSRMASTFKDNPNVVALSLRNELRGSKQDSDVYYEYMQKGAEAVHGANPNVLVIISGFDYDTNLSHLRDKLVPVTFTGKVVYELHWYQFTDPGKWDDADPKKTCEEISDKMMQRGGFLLEKGIPLFVSEFGIDQSGNNAGDNNFIDCFFGVAAKLDFDWSLWALQGSYYTREGVVEMEESDGVMNKEWDGMRNGNFLMRIAAIQRPTQGPGISST